MPYSNLMSLEGCSNTLRNFPGSRGIVIQGMRDGLVAFQT
jgi:hypothetical protein